MKGSRTGSGGRSEGKEGEQRKKIDEGRMMAGKKKKEKETGRKKGNNQRQGMTKGRGKEGVGEWRRIRFPAGIRGMRPPGAR